MKVTEPTYLVIPFEQLKEAKHQAGKLENGQNALEFDADKKLWFARPGADLSKLSRWRTDTALVMSAQGDPQQEFGDFIRVLGGKLSGPPEMDGKAHRIAMDDDTPGKQSGVYVGHKDGFANGWFIDHRAGDHRNVWSSASVRPDPTVIAHQKAIAAQEQHRREQRKIKEHNQVAQASASRYAPLNQAGHNHAYLNKKGVKAAKGLRSERENLVIPLSNAAGDIRTLQTIAPDGSKRLSKGGQKEGSFFVVGGSLKNGSPIVFAEGYATASSAAMALQHPVVMTVDSGNLVKVAKALHEHYPDSPKLFLGDDDLPKPKRPGNPGKEKAEEAAEATGGTVILPTFTPSERQQGLTDFNDFHQARGLEALTQFLAPTFAALNVTQVEHTVENIPVAEPAQAPVDDMPPPSIPEPTEPNISTNDAKMPASSNPEPAVTVAAPAEPSLPVQEDYADYSHIIAELDEQEAQEYSPTVPAPVSMKDEQETDDAKLIDKQEKIAPAEFTSLNEAADHAEDVDKPVSFARRLAPVPSPINENVSTPPTETQASDAELEVDGIRIETPDGKQTRQVTPLDLDALMQQITHEIAADGRSVKYLFSGEPAFVDHGDRLTMANATASQNDAMILTALLVAREQYRGRIELTGSDEFKQRAVTLIAEYNLDVKMKNPQQQLMLDEARKALSNEPAPGDTPTPVGTPTAAIVPERESTSPSVAPSEKNSLPPELRPTVLPTDEPRNASRKESEAGLTGTLLGHGQARYNFDESENNSYYVHLRTAGGERYIWGKELAQIVPASGLKKDDVVTLSWLGNKEVTVTAKVRDEKGKVIVNADGTEKTEEIATHRNQWEIKSAIDPQLLVSHEQQATPPATLVAYDMTHFTALQQQVIQLAKDAGISLPPLPEPTNDLVWLKPNGEGTAAPATRPAQPNLPVQTQDAGTVLMKAMDSENQLKLLLVKGLGEYVQGVVQYQGEYHPVLGKLCTNDKGHRYLALNAVTTEGVTAIGYGNAVNHESGANNAFVFRLKGEKDRLYAPLVEPAKCPPALHKQLGFTHDYIPPSQTPQRRDIDIVENTSRPTPQSPRPGV
jgi:putative DNA primase/helicase